MRCVKCGAETGTDRQFCNGCEEPVRVLTPEERESFEGITILEAEHGENYDYQEAEPEPQIYVKQIKFAPGGFLGMLIIGAVLFGLMLIAFPLILVIGIVAVIGLLLRGFWKRR